MSLFTITLALILLSVGCALAQQTECALFTLEGEDHTICANFTIQDCLINFQITVDNLPFYESDVTLHQLTISNGKSFCSTDENTNCEVCINWDGTAIQETGALQGCMSLVSSCFNDMVDLGCFNDTMVQQCSNDQGKCMNECSKRGICEPSGSCNCDSGAYGEDCSESCSNFRDSAYTKLSGSSYHKAEPHKDFLGLIKIRPYAAEASLSVTLSGDNHSGTKVSVYASKSCTPDPTIGFYDVYFEVDRSDFMNFHSLMSDCDRVTGGTWYVRIVCSSTHSCTFVTSVEITSVTPIVHSTYFEAITAPNTYYYMNVTAGYHLEVATSTDLNLTVEVRPAICPTDVDYSDRDDTPDVYTYSGVTLKKFVLTSSDAEGIYFIRIHDDAFTLGQMTMIPNAYSLSLSTATCSEPCVFGSCSSDNHCSCFPHWSGVTCTLNTPPLKNDHDGEDDDDDDDNKNVHRHHSSSSDHHHHHHSSSSHDDDHDDHDGHHDSSEGLSGGAIAGITIGSISGVVLFVIVLVVLVLCICCCCCKKKKDSYGLYALITTETE